MKSNSDLTLNGYYRVGDKKDPEEELKSNHLQKGYEYIREYLTLMIDKGCVLKKVSTLGSSYGWKHRVERYTSQFREDKRTWHHIPNGLFIAACREMGVPELLTADKLNAEIGLGQKALEYHEQLAGK